ncbi:MAG: GNAT family N-acetyltransferase [Maribacter sp.]|uniref:GNAT family N-acetyltransferase n=1 Tax=Maribacter sp. TaxID=1897614 RepID=UPI00329801E2
MQRSIVIRLATITDVDAIEKVGNALFDYPIKRNRAIEFLNDARHHLFLAFDGENVVGMASGFHYVHPDKDPELFMNEVGVLEAFQNRGIGKALVKALWNYGKELGCLEAWIGTEKSNIAAQKCYEASGGKPDDEPFILYEFD